MDITIVTTARTDDEGTAFLDAFGFPFRQESIEQSWPRRHLIEKQQRNQVQGPRLHAVPALRAAAVGVPQVRPVPDLPAEHGARRRDPRRDQGELVRGGHAHDNDRPHRRHADPYPQRQHRRCTTRCGCRPRSSRSRSPTILEREGYIAGFDVAPSTAGPGSVLEIRLKYSRRPRPGRSADCDGCPSRVCGSTPRPTRSHGSSVAWAWPSLSTSQGLHDRPRGAQAPRWAARCSVMSGERDADGRHGLRGGSLMSRIGRDSDRRARRGRRHRGRRPGHGDGPQGDPGA